MSLTRPYLVLVTSLLTLAAGVATAVEAPITIRGAALYELGTVPARVYVDMDRLPQLRTWRAGDPIKEIPQRKGLPRDFVAPAPALQTGGDPLRTLNGRAPSGSTGRGLDTPQFNQDGSGFSGVNPPDPAGDVGNDHYIQMINGSTGTIVRILDKSGKAVIDPFRLRDLAMGSGTGCTAGSGDPIVLFDKTAANPGGDPGRWFLSEFTSSSFCVYISQTADPTDGTWFIYEFASDSGGLPDYPKYGVWPDAYYIGANEDAASIDGAGRAVYALDRQSMIQGLATRPTQVFEASRLAGFAFDLLHPADWDGRRAPPEGSPGLFVRHRDDEVHDPDTNDPTRDWLEIWRFAVDWDDPGNSWFSGPQSIPVAEFESELCGLTSFSCVPQPDTSTLLDPLREPMMWRVQYRNFGAHETVIGSWVTDAGGGAVDIHGVRWTELRNTGGGWTLHQQGTVSPDDVHRWMSSIAMDRDGNIALGYNVSDSVSVFPGLRYTGRLATDPLGSMPVPEVTLVDGSAANGSNRYGDYSSLNVDPVDSCTFWFTGEYNTSNRWGTRIGKFVFDSCGKPEFYLDAMPVRLEACLASGSQVLPEIRLDIGKYEGRPEFMMSDGFESPEVLLAFSAPLAPGFMGSITPDRVVPSNPAAEAIVSLAVDAGVISGNYLVEITGSTIGDPDQSAAIEIDVADAVPDAPTLQSPPDGAVAVDRWSVFEWTALAQTDSHLFELATDAFFDDIVASEVVTGSSIELGQKLGSLTEYHWRVSSENQCGMGTAAVASFTTELAPGECGPDELETTYFFDDLEAGEGGWTHSAGVAEIDTWTLQSSIANSGSFAWQADSVAEISDQFLVSPTISLPAGVNKATLEFFTAFDLEQSAGGCWDAGLVEVSTDAGQSWTPFDAESVLENPYTGIVENTSSSPIADLAGWCGAQSWTKTVIDLRGLEGAELMFRFRLGTDVEVAAENWLIDEVAVQSCE